MREVLGCDTRAWLVFLLELVVVRARTVVGGVRARELGDAGCGRDLDLGGAELSVVKEEGGFGGAGTLLVGSCLLGVMLFAYVSFSKVTVAL